MDRSAELDQILSAVLSVEKVPPPDPKVLQETLIELYAILGIPRGIPNKKAVNYNFPKVQSTNPHAGSYNYENSKAIKRSLNEVAMVACKRPRASITDQRPNTFINSSMRTTESSRQVQGLHNQPRRNSLPDSVLQNHGTPKPGATQLPLQVWLQNGGYVQSIQIPTPGGAPKIIYLIPKSSNLPVGAQIPLNSFLNPK